MTGIFGDVCLMLAFSMALVQASAPLLARRNDRFLRLLQPASAAQLCAIVCAFFLLVFAYATSDFSLLSVVLNSHTDKPLIYKISGSWGNHEGSMLLWMLVLSGFGFLAGRGESARPLRQLMLAIQGVLAAGLLLFILCSSSPFTEISPAPAQGQSLNPLLEDIGLALHPPMLYLGYVGFGIVFAFAVAGMLQQRIDREWSRVIHPWICASWGLLSLGIGLGSWWAYRELGWGGWWFWDPVENVSLLPWLGGTSLLHANRAFMVRGAFPRWTLLLSILCFTLSLIGTFIVRSGLLVSVHSFASDPERGLFILIYVTVVVGGALAAYARFNPSDDPAPAPLLSRQGLILFNTLLLLSACATILLALLYPILLQLLSLPSITVGAPYFNRTILPLGVPLILLAGIAPLLPWVAAPMRSLKRPLLFLSAAALIGGSIAAALSDHMLLISAGGIALASWLAAGTFFWAVKQVKSSTGLTKSGWPMLLAHGGAAIFVAAVTVSATHKQTYDIALRAGERSMAGPYEFVFMQERLVQGPNYVGRVAYTRLFYNGDEIATLSPEIRHYPVRNMQTTEAAIDSQGWRDIYVTAGLQVDPDLLGFTLHINPAISGLWLGFLLMGAGGLAAAGWRAIATHKGSVDG